MSDNDVQRFRRGLIVGAFIGALAVGILRELDQMRDG